MRLTGKQLTAFAQVASMMHVIKAQHIEAFDSGGIDRANTLQDLYDAFFIFAGREQWRSMRVTVKTFATYMTLDEYREPIGDAELKSFDVACENFHNAFSNGGR